MTSMAEPCIRFERRGDGLALITLDRPERLNALSGPLLDQLRTAVAECDEDPEVRVILIAGSARPDGRPCFSAGVDVKAFAEHAGVGEYQGFELTNAIDDLLTPSIAVIDGVCSTGGVELALACDFRIVAPGAQISDWHLKKLGTGLGAWGASTRWASLVGTTRAKEIILTGKVVDGEEAFRIGFATAIHPSEKLMDEAFAFANQIARMDPRGVRLTLAHLDRIGDMSRDQALRWAQLAGDWLGVKTDPGEIEARILGGAAQPSQPATPPQPTNKKA